jgi:hypothetical protein
MAFSIQQALEAFFDNSGGGGAGYGGTSQSGSITGNPTGGSGTGSSYTTGDIWDGTQIGPDGNLESEWTSSDWSGDSYRVMYNVSDGSDYYDMVVVYHPGTSTGTILSNWLASGWQSYNTTVGGGSRQSAISSVTHGTHSTNGFVIRYLVKRALHSPKSLQLHLSLLLEFRKLNSSWQQVNHPIPNLR